MLRVLQRAGSWLGNRDPPAVGDRTDGAIPGPNARLVVAGDSAGGTLAAVSALMARDRAGPDIDYQVLLYPGIGVREDQPSVREHDGIVLAAEDLEWFEAWYYGIDVHQNNPYADPSRACSLEGLAPSTVVTAGFDPLRDGGVAYADQLAATGMRSLTATTRR